MSRDWDTSSQAATELAAFCASTSDAPSVKSKTRSQAASKYKDAFTWASGKPVCCEACGEAKQTPDPAFPLEHLWWNVHGSEDPARHSTICFYDETSWKKQKYSMTKSEFIDFAATDAGKVELKGFKEKMIEKRKTGGRITSKLLSATESAGVKRKTIDESAINEPDDVWMCASDYEDKHGRKPEEDGFQCCWITTPKNKRMYGFWTEGVGDITRSRSKKTQVGVSEKLDCSECALSDDQLAQRFKAESKAMQDALPQAHSEKHIKAAPHVLKSVAAPLGGSLLAPNEVTAEPKKGQKRGGASVIQSSSSENPKGSKTGKPSTPQSGAQAGPIPIVRMLEQKSEVEKAWDGLMNVTKLDDITAAEREAVKTIKALEKKQQRLQCMDKLDSSHLSFQIEVDESHEKLTSMNAALMELKKYKSVATAKSKGPNQGSSIEAL